MILLLYFLIAVYLIGVAIFLFVVNLGQGFLDLEDIGHALIWPYELYKLFKSGVER